jgi:16S rRNA (uracil1498-N3)-methyltransferase
MILKGDDARHIAKSLRKEPGDRIQVVDGTGQRHEVELSHVRPDQVVGVVRDTISGAGEPPYRLSIGIGLLKNRNRFETFLEKAAECGVHRIVPMLTERTEAESLREKRCENILIAAMKQSGRSVLPNLAAPTPFAEVLSSFGAGSGGGAPGRWIAHEAATAPALPEAVALFRQRRKEPPQAEACVSEDSASQNEGRDNRPELLVMIGPEGGFSENEIDEATSAGVQPVRLGPNRLRAETAGIVSAAAVSMAFASHKRPQGTAFL